MRQLTLKQLKTIFIVLLSVFLAASAASCIWLYCQAEQKTECTIQLNMAVAESSSVAETLKAHDGSLTKTARLLHSTGSYTISDNTLTLYYDENMQPSSEYDSAYTIFVSKEKSEGFYLIYIKVSGNPEKNKIYELEFKILRERR